MGDEQNCENVHGGILKTIFLFLENNNLQETAALFKSEVSRKYERLNLQEIPARTLILRPLENDEVDENLVTNENIIILISGKSNIKIDLQEVDNEGSDVQKCVDETKRPNSSQYDCSDCSFKNEDVSINVIANYKTNYAETEIANLEKTLCKLQNEHLKLIQIASQLTSALNTLEKDQKQNFHVILNKYKDALPDLYAYASQNEADFVDLVNNLDQTENDEDNSVIKSSTNGDDNNREESSNSHISASHKSSFENLQPTANAFYNAENDVSYKNSLLSVLGNERSRNSAVSQSDGQINLQYGELYNQITNEGSFTSIGFQHKQDDNNAYNRRNSLDYSSLKRRERLKNSLSAPPMSKHLNELNHEMDFNYKMVAKAERDYNNEEIVDETENVSSKTSSIYTKATSEKEDEITAIPARLADFEVKSSDGISSIMDFQYNTNEYKAYPILDYGMINNALIDGEIDVKLRILQALRWRLTRGDNKAKHENIKDYIENDILHLNCGDHFLRRYFCLGGKTSQQFLQEEIARFMNTLASLSIGRSYLLKGYPFIKDIFLPLLMTKVKKTNRLYLTKEFMIAATQKLSLCETMRDLFVSEGIVEWLVSYISNYHQQMINYEAEYSTALFMNMCLHQETRTRCNRIPNEVILLLTTLIKSPHECCSAYLNGILYTMLSIPSVHERALKVGLYDLIEEQIKKFNDPDLIKQLEFIISLKTKSNWDEIEWHVKDKINFSDEDYIEPEIDMNDSDYVSPFGEQFLQAFHWISPKTERALISCKKDYFPEPRSIFCSDHSEAAAGDFCNRTSVSRSDKEMLLDTESTGVQVSTDRVNKYIQTKENDIIKTPKEELVEEESLSGLEIKLQELRELFSSPTQRDGFLTCNLSVFRLNRRQELQDLGRRYKCDCYDVINDIVNDTNKDLEPHKGGRKPNNVTFGPFVPAVVYQCPSNTCNVNLEKNIFRTKSKIKRTP